MKSNATKLSDTTIARMATISAALSTQAMTASQIAVATNDAISRVKHAIQIMYELGDVHISGYGKNVIAIYSDGYGRDAKRPDIKPNTYRHKARVDPHALPAAFFQVGA